MKNLKLKQKEDRLTEEAATAAICYSSNTYSLLPAYSINFLYLRSCTIHQCRRYEPLNQYQIVN